MSHGWGSGTRDAVPTRRTHGLLHRCCCAAARARGHRARQRPSHLGAPGYGIGRCRLCLAVIALLGGRRSLSLW